MCVCPCFRMSEDQEFCLRWNDFHSSFHVSLEALRGDESFTDVTLSCSGHLFKAHRIILSTCSSHFRDILKVGSGPVQSRTKLAMGMIRAHLRVW